MHSDFWPEVYQAVAGNDYKIYAYMNDGKVHVYDAAPLFENPKGIFRSLADKTSFQKMLTVINGTVAWDINGNRSTKKCVDIDPYTIYESPVVEDPLSTF